MPVMAHGPWPTNAIQQGRRRGQNRGRSRGGPGPRNRGSRGGGRRPTTPSSRLESWRSGMGADSDVGN
eukprot:15481124-Alexandrium_andersonii.AAC.1